MSVLLLLTVVDENMLLHIHVGDRNLLWYIAVFSAALAVSRSLIPEPEDAVFDAEGAMRLLVGYTHYFPKRWRGRSTTFDVRDELLGMFQFRVISFFQVRFYTHFDLATTKGWEFDKGLHSRKRGTQAT